MEPDFLDLMPDTITVEPWVSNPADGSPGAEYGSLKTYRCLIVRHPKMVRLPTGETAVTNAEIYVATTDVISPKDRITMPDGKQPPIFQAYAYHDEKGPHHAVIYV